MENKKIILEIKNLHKDYPVLQGLILPKEVGRVQAVNQISFQLYQGETLGIIGESGCGKTTLARVVMGLEDATSGSITFLGQEIKKGMSPSLRRHMQMVFQDPYSSLDPRMSVKRILEEPLRIHCHMSKTEKKERILPLLEQVGLSEDALGRFPHEFSGGQRQRIGIARALVLEPELLICDEPVSALDVSVRAQILNLLHTLQKEKGLTYLFVSHDMSVIRHISDRILVLYLGQMMEMADKKTLFSRPAHPYTKALMEAVPIPDPRVKDQCRVLAGEIPSPIHTPAGCPFSTRCPSATDRCRNERPMPREIEPGHLVACHLYQEQRKETA